MDNHLLPMRNFFHLQFQIEMIGFAPMETINFNTIEGYNRSFFLDSESPFSFHFILFTGTDH